MTLSVNRRPRSTRASTPRDPLTFVDSAASIGDLGENGLRVVYQPVWNAVLTGFGNHEQGASTRRSRRSKWDTVHRGRNRTFGSDRYDRSQLERAARNHIQQQIASYNAAPWHRE
jgi:hypothetical protein